jgi:hypothetical protein
LVPENGVAYGREEPAVVSKRKYELDNFLIVCKEPAIVPTLVSTIDQRYIYARLSGGHIRVWQNE